MARYDAFLSYSRRDAAAADAVQRGLERLLRPFFRLRALRVYRDETNLPPGADLYASLEDALLDSDWLVLLASPESSHSDPIKFELRRWYARKPAGRLIVVVVDGVVAFDDATGRVDWERTDALPRWIQDSSAKKRVDSELLEWERALVVDLTSLPDIEQGSKRTLEPVVAALRGSTVEAARRRYWCEQVAGIVAALVLVALPAGYLFQLTRAAAGEQQNLEDDLERNRRALDDASAARDAERQAKAIADEERAAEEQLERTVRDEAEALEEAFELSEAELEVEEAYRGIFVGDQRRELGDRSGATEAYLEARETLLKHGHSDFPLVTRWVEASPWQSLRVRIESSLVTHAGGRIASLGPGRLVDVATGHVLGWAQRPGSGIYDPALGGFRRRSKEGDVVLYDLVTSEAVTLTSLATTSGTEVHDVGFFRSGQRLVLTGTDPSGGFVEIRTYDGRVVSRFDGQPTRAFVLRLLEDRKVLLSHRIPVEVENEVFGAVLPSLSLLDLKSGATIWTDHYLGNPLSDSTIYARRPASIVDLPSGEVVTDLEEPNGQGKALVNGGSHGPLLVDGGRFILFISGSGDLVLLDTASGRHLGQIPVGIEDGWKIVAAAPGPGEDGSPDSVLLLARHPEYQRTEDVDWAGQPTGRVRNRIPNDRIYVLSFDDARTRLGAEAGEVRNRASLVGTGLEGWTESEDSMLGAGRPSLDAHAQVATLPRARLEQARANGDPLGSIGLARLALLQRSSTGRREAREHFEEARSMDLDGDLLEYVEICLRALELPAPDSPFVTGGWRR